MLDGYKQTAVPAILCGPMPATISFLNVWPASGENDAQNAVTRIGEGFLGRMASNAFNEFWPDAIRRLLHKK